MSEVWSKLRDVDRLADGRVRIDFSIPFDELPRVRAQLREGGEGRVSGKARFDRDRDWPVADVAISARAVLTCQRCMKPLERAIESASRIVLVADAAEAERAPAELETVRAPGHRVRVRDLVEEELLLALPIVPLHPAGDCAAAGEARGSFRESAVEVRNRPFERLDELLRRRS